MTRQGNHSVRCGRCRFWVKAKDATEELNEYMNVPRGTGWCALKTKPRHGGATTCILREPREGDHFGY